MTFACRIINYPDCENGIYVIQTDEEDIMFSFIKCHGIQEFFINQAGAVRQAITTFSDEYLNKSFKFSIILFCIYFSFRSETTLIYIIQQIYE